MNDETKHKVDKELYFFFKWFLIGGLPALIIYVWLESIGFISDYWYYSFGILQSTYTHPRILTCALWIMYLDSFVLIGAYLFRLYKWVMKWK